MKFLERAAIYDKTKALFNRPYWIAVCILVLSIMACVANAVCLAHPNWIEKYIYFINATAYDFSYFRLKSFGLWSVCYYEEFDSPDVITRCTNIKFNDFTLVVQISECVSLIFNIVSIVLSAIFLINSMIKVDFHKSSLHKEARKYLFVSNGIATIALCVATPLYISDANKEGVGYFQPSLEQLIKKQAPIDPADRTSVPYYATFSWALWAQLGSIVLNITITFICLMLLLIHQKKKRKQPEEVVARKEKAEPVEQRPRSESRRVLFTRQTSALSLQTIPSSPNEY